MPSWVGGPGTDVRGVVEGAPKESADGRMMERCIAESCGGHAVGATPCPSRRSITHAHRRTHKHTNHHKNTQTQTRIHTHTKKHKHTNTLTHSLSHVPRPPFRAVARLEIEWSRRGARTDTGIIPAHGQDSLSNQTAPAERWADNP